MPVKRTKTENAVTKYEETRIKLTRGPQGLQIGAEERSALTAVADREPYTFDQIIAPVEQAIEPHVGDVDPEPLTQSWYANDIRDRIAAVRMLQRQSPAMATAVALELGCVLSEARASHAWAEDLGLGRKRRKHAGIAGRAGVEARREAKKKKDTPLEQAVDACLAKDPTLTTGKVANKLVTRFGRHSGNRARDIEALRKRITRL